MPHLPTFQHLYPCSVYRHAFCATTHQTGALSPIVSHLPRPLHKQLLPFSWHQHPSLQLTFSKILLNSLIPKCTFLSSMAHFSTPLWSKNSSKELFPFLFLLSRTHPVRLSCPRTHGNQCPLPSVLLLLPPAGQQDPPIDHATSCVHLLIWLLRNILSGVYSYFTPTHVGGQAQSVASSLTTLTPGDHSQSLCALYMPMAPILFLSWVSSMNTRPYFSLST